MKCLKRNKTPFHYALFKEYESIKDEDGNETGEKKILYHEPILAKGNISFDSEAHAERFGTSLQYDGVIALEDTNCPIDENTILFIKVSPEKDEDGEWVFDFIVSKVVPSLNSLLIAIRSVESR